ncbi:MAG: diguanylate cyclase [Planctomycetes bacterium]|nr:diguanylate cyclase [Planctomycetota bacterium]
MSERPKAILAHYDNEALTRQRMELEAEGFRVQATNAGPDVLKRVEKETPDVIVLEALLPRQNGLSVLKALKASLQTRALPVLMLLDDGDTYTENRALICGADAILKRGPDGLLAEGALVAKLRALLKDASLTTPTAEGSGEPENLQRILDTAAQNLRQENPVLAHITDPLTGLFNAEYAEIKLSEEFKRSRRFGDPLAVVDIQLRLGQGGEERDKDSNWRHVLNEVAGMLLCESRDIDVLARHDATTFRLILPHTPVKGAQAMVERILGSIADRRLAATDERGPLSACAGLADYTGEGLESAEELKRRSQEALKQAWREGSFGVVTWTQELPGEA